MPPGPGSSGSRDFYFRLFSAETGSKYLVTYSTASFDDCFPKSTVNSRIVTANKIFLNRVFQQTHLFCEWRKR